VTGVLTVNGGQPLGGHRFAGTCQRLHWVLDSGNDEAV
jgi:hypothetical protein